MFVDASAAVAILNSESDAKMLSAKLSGARDAFLSPISYYEIVTGLARAAKLSTAEAVVAVDIFIQEKPLKSLAIDDSIARIAVAAFARYGKGRHKAALNMGDCFAYACAKTLDVPLLCKGNDFRHTDIPIA